LVQVTLGQYRRGFQSGLVATEAEEKSGDPLVAAGAWAVWSDPAVQAAVGGGYPVVRNAYRLFSNENASGAAGRLLSAAAAFTVTTTTGEGFLAYCARLEAQRHLPGLTPEEFSVGQTPFETGVPDRDRYVLAASKTASNARDRGSVVWRSYVLSPAAFAAGAETESDFQDCRASFQDLGGSSGLSFQEFLHWYTLVRPEPGSASAAQYATGFLRASDAETATVAEKRAADSSAQRGRLTGQTDPEERSLTLEALSSGYATQAALVRGSEVTTDTPTITQAVRGFESYSAATEALRLGGDGTTEAEYSAYQDLFLN
jgi:hypothetical protein